MSPVENVLQQRKHGLKCPPWVQGMARDKGFIDGRWFFDVAGFAWCYIEPGWYELGTRPEVAKRLDAREAEMLVKTMDEQGYIKPRLDERLRTEDLKITHRLLDIIEGKSVAAARERISYRVRGHRMRGDLQRFDSR